MLGDRVAAGRDLGEEQLLLDVGGQEEEVEELGDAGAAEAQAAGEACAVLDFAGVDHGLHPVSERGHAGGAQGALDLYRIEYAVAAANGLGTAAHAQIRRTDSKKLVDEFNREVFDKIDKHGPKTNMGKALTYAKNQRVALEHFLSDPAVPLDNNLAERELRIIATGQDSCSLG